MRHAILITNQPISDPGGDVVVYEQHPEPVELPDPGSSAALHRLYELIGCDLIEFAPCDETVGIVIDEEGLYSGEPRNLLAEAYWRTVDIYGCLDAGNVLMGTVVIVGPTNGEGEFGDAPAEAYDYFGMTVPA